MGPSTLTTMTPMNQAVMALQRHSASMKMKWLRWGWIISEQSEKALHSILMMRTRTTAHFYLNTTLEALCRAINTTIKQTSIKALRSSNLELRLQKSNKIMWLSSHLSHFKLSKGLKVAKQSMKKWPRKTKIAPIPFQRRLHLSIETFSERNLSTSSHSSIAHYRSSFPLEKPIK